MKKKEELFFLIKSMSKSEKRHFKLFSSKSSSPKNYLQLFETIDAQEVYDELAIREKFKGEVFLLQLTSTKNYLRNLILKSLRIYHSEISKEGMVKDILRNAEILYQKGLYQMALFETRKAFKLANEYEVYGSQFEAIAWEKRILQAENPQQIEKLNQLSKAQIKIASQLQEYSRVWNMNVQLEETENAEIEILENEPLQLQMFKRLFYFQQLVRKGQPENAALHLKAIIEKYDEKPHRKKEEAETYLVLLNNLLALYVYRKKYSEALPLIKEVKDFIGTLSQYGAPIFKTFLRVVNIELEIYRESKNLEKGLQLINEIYLIIDKSNLHVPEAYRISFWFQFANLYFQAGRYNEALKWVNVLLDNKNTTTRVDLVTFAHWLNLMIHFELKNYFVLRYFVDSTKRFLKKRKKMEAYEEVLLKLFSKVANVPSAELRGIFKGAYDKLTVVNNSIPESVLDYIDFLSWLRERTV